MAETHNLTDWDKLGLCEMHRTWHAASYFKAPYSLKKLIGMGLIEEKMSEPSGKPYDTVPTQMLQLTPSGIEVREELLASGFNPIATIRQSA